MKIAVVHNWPGQRNSELELFKRIARITKDLGHQCVLVDPLGHPLTNDGEHYPESSFIDFRQIAFCLNLHYWNPNFFNTFSYAVNWNPLNYIVRSPIDGGDLPIDDVVYRTNCLVSHDVLLSAGSEELDDFVAALNLWQSFQLLDTKLSLHTTAEIVTGIDFPDFSQFKVFYIGANWECHEGVSRHNGLVEQLDKTGLIDFYGVRKQHGVFLWEGIEHYKGELPFDGGKSIVAYSNRCGVSLVLHSQAHRDSGLVSTRIFQACAAKTLTICDDNSFIGKYFGDSVLSFPYKADNPDENVRHIKELLHWVEEHPDEALNKAKAAHQIFRDKFSLHSEVAALFSQHPENVKRYLCKFGSRSPDTLVDVLFFYQGDTATLLHFLEGLAQQVSISCRAVIYALHRDEKDLRAQVATFKVAVEFLFLPDDNQLPLAGRLVATYIQRSNRADYFTVYSPDCRWHSFHLTQLAAALEKNATIAQSGVFVKNSTFDDLETEYYHHAKASINHNQNVVTAKDIGLFAANKFLPAAFIFKGASFRDGTLLQALRFFDNGWAFFLITWHYLHSGELPGYVAKLTVEYTRQDSMFDIDSYQNSRHNELFERSLAYSMLHANPKYVSLAEVSLVQQGSIHQKILGLLKNRPVLLRVYSYSFTIFCRCFRLPH